jgi:S1-C subfamily serine protease
MPFTLARLSAFALVGLVAAGVALGVGFALGDGDSDPQTVVMTVESVDSTAPARFTATPDGGAMSVQEIYESRAPGVVQVISSTAPSNEPSGEEPSAAQGSGFVIDKAGHVVTNYHVVENSDEVQVNFSSDDGVKAKVVGVDPSTDIAVLEIDAHDRALTPIPLGDSEAVRVGDAVVAIGNPFGLERTATAGIVSALQRDIRAPNGFTINRAIQTDAPINHGNSGGPLLNTRGQVIGVNSQIETGGASEGNVGIGFAVPINTVRQVVAELIRDGKVEHAYVGISMQDVGPDLAAEYRLPVDEGALVVEVKPNSPAQRAGLRAGDQGVVFNGQNYVLGGDIITRADGEEVASPEDLQAIVMTKKPADLLTIEIHRGDAKRTVSVTLGRQPDEPAG